MFDILFYIFKLCVKQLLNNKTHDKSNVVLSYESNVNKYLSALRMPNVSCNPKKKKEKKTWLSPFAQQIN